MEEKIICYAIEHPVLISIIIPIILGILVSFFSETIKQIFFKERPKQVKIVFRLITFGIALVFAILVLGILNGFINTWELQVLFICVNTFVPFVFYHLKGKQLVELIINKLFKKVEKTNI